MAPATIASVLAAAGFDVSNLHPDFQKAALAFLEDAKAAGLDPRLQHSYRTAEEQDKLYAQGRTAPGKIVTKAKGGQSNHNYGVAMDVVPGPLVSKPNWDPENPMWGQLGQVAAKHGLEWGGNWKFQDKPHIQMAGANWRKMQNDPKYAQHRPSGATAPAKPDIQPNRVPPASGVSQAMNVMAPQQEIPNAEFVAGMQQNAAPDAPMQKRDIFEGVSQAIQQAQASGPGGSVPTQSGDPFQAVQAAIMANQKAQGLAGMTPDVEAFMALGKKKPVQPVA